VGEPPVPLAFRRERTLAVGSLALLSPIPLLFTNALELGVLVLFLGILSLVLLRVRRGTTSVLGDTWLNAAGVVYLPVLFLDLRYGSHTLLKTMLHLLLFTTVLKLAAIKRERDLSVVLILAGFLFLASVSTSFHYAILLYLVVYAAVAWPLLVRWGLWRDLATAPEEWERDREAQRLPGKGPVAASLVASFLLAVPLFFVLPRLKAPFVRGIEAGRDITTGFSDTVDPDLVGTLKRNERVFLRITTERPVTDESVAVLRMRMVALTRWDGAVWRKMERGGRFLPGLFGTRVPLGRGRGADSEGDLAMTVDLLPLGSRSLPYPVQGSSLKLNEGSFRTPAGALLEMDESRNLRFQYEPDRTIQYTAYTGGRASPDLVLGSDPNVSVPPHSPELAAFARERIGAIDPAADPESAARAIETNLKLTFSYSLELVKHGPRPVEEFLLERRRGHCQTFATAMALLLRELGIPSRFVTGFAGGELGPFGQYVLVRGENAHAWVEAWCGEKKGWVTFDPTPFDGVPALTRVPLSKRFRQLADGVEFFYDRYVLSFGQGDQIELIQKIREGIGIVAERARDAAASMRGLVAGLSRVRGPWKAGLALAALAAFVALVSRLRGARWTTRGLPPASAAYRKLQRMLSRRGAAVSPASAPAETLEAAARWAGAKKPAAEIVSSYVRESFGGIGADAGEARRLERLLAELRDALSRKAA
jgi:protein-glutamine gamma-glutamyltransferase